MNYDTKKIQLGFGGLFGIGFNVSNFGAAFLGGLVTSIVSIFLTLLFKDETKRQKKTRKKTG